jgi:hypothetical protein
LKLLLKNKIKKEVEENYFREGIERKKEVNYIFSIIILEEYRDNYN